jgi:error-prone DNA polymerase
MQMGMAVGDSPPRMPTLRRAMGSSAAREDRVGQGELYEACAARAGRGDRGRHLREDPGVRELRLRREPLPRSRCSCTPASWLKLHYPAAFLAGLLRSQPMGFYSAATLTGDARRHGVEVRRPDIRLSGRRRPWSRWIRPWRG